MASAVAAGLPLVQFAFLFQSLSITPIHVDEVGIVTGFTITVAGTE